MLSPGSRPIQRKPRIQKKAEFPQSELGKSLNEDNDFVPPHILSLPAQNFNALELSSRPVSMSFTSKPRIWSNQFTRVRQIRRSGFLYDFFAHLMPKEDGSGSSCDSSTFDSTGHRDSIRPLQSVVKYTHIEFHSQSQVWQSQKCIHKHLFSCEMPL